MMLNSVSLVRGVQAMLQRSSRCLFAGIIALGLVLSAIQSSALAANEGKSDDCTKGGTIVETNFTGKPKHFTLHLTDKNNGGNEIPPGNGFPRDLGIIPAGGSVSVPVPPVPGVQRCDAFNTCEAVAGAGGPSGGVGVGAMVHLRIESLFFNTTTSEYELESIFDYVGDAYGPDFYVKVPDLYADTNGDNEIGVGDLLYSLVDLRAFTNSGDGPIPAFVPDQIFSIVNGTVASLPGMLFSTTAFTFTAAGGYSGTPYNGSGVAQTDHEIAQTPEPSSVLLMAGGLLVFVLGGAARSRVKIG